MEFLSQYLQQSTILSWHVLDFPQLSVSKPDYIKGDWCWKSRPDLVLFDPVKMSDEFFVRHLGHNHWYILTGCHWTVSETRGWLATTQRPPHYHWAALISQIISYHGQCFLSKYERQINVHVCISHKVIIHHCWECNQVLHEARIPSRYHNDQSHILLHASPQCWGVAASTFVLPSSVLEIFCKFTKWTMIMAMLPKIPGTTF